MAKKIIRTQGGGVEEGVSSVASILLISGTTALALCIWYSGVVTKENAFDDWGEKGVAVAWIASGVGTLLVSIAFFSILRSSTEPFGFSRK
jgi:hypothetical protein